MHVLAIETATLCGSVALGKIENGQHEILFSKRWKRQRSHGELLTASIEEALTVSGLEMSEIDQLALDVGPGSFTGIRVGLSVAKALGYGINKPIVPFSSVEVLASAVFSLGNKLPLITLLNAHKSQVYFAKFQPTKSGWKMQGKPKACAIDKLIKSVTTKSLCVGDGYLAALEHLTPGLRSKLLRTTALDDYPQAQTMVRLLENKKYSAKFLAWTDVEALYIRGSEAEEKLKTGILKPLPTF